MYTSYGFKESVRDTEYDLCRHFALFFHFHLLTLCVVNRNSLDEVRLPIHIISISNSDDSRIFISSDGTRGADRR